MTRVRTPDDWDRDLAAARPIEKRVRAALESHPAISHLSDFTREMDVLDFQFRFERQDVHVDVKAKFQRLSDEIAEQWPETPRDELFVVDETSFRQLLWQEGLGYLLVDDEPRDRWHVFGPWELCLGPRRRFERRGNRTGSEFLKGKLLLDFRTASRTTDGLDVDALLDVVRRSRNALREVRALPIRAGEDLPVLPQIHRPEQEELAAATDEAQSPGAGGTQLASELDALWSGLSTELVGAIKTTWGWAQPTQVQRAAFQPILQGRNVLLLAPTAGGKTEAALLPLLDLYRQQGWGSVRPSILAISPLRALIDDQLERWRTATALVGATAFAWHSDVDAEAKKAFKDRPHDALLTTPESLELFLTSPSHDEKALFTGLRAVVIDEVHAFVGTPRGAQLASLLERLLRFVDADFQRIGLSATVGNPQRVLDWLRGGSLRESQLVMGMARMQGEDASVRTYGDVGEAFDTITEAVRGQRALVFTRSRRRAEELAHLLHVPVHHSSVAAADREAAVRGLRAGSTRCIVATASLELGIDIGDLDLVVHDGAPSSPSSYLQRLGRAGRKSGQRRIVFTIEEPDDLLLLLGILARARRDDLDQVDPQRGARLVLGQQALALTLQAFIANRSQLHETLRWSPTFADLHVDIEATIDHLLAYRLLQSDGDRLVLGAEGHRRFGGRSGIVNLLATFESHIGAAVVDESGRKVGSVDWKQFDEREGATSLPGFVLSGRAWTVVRVDRGEGVVTVRPSDRGKPPSWRGPTLEVERPTWEAVKDVLNSTEVPVQMDDRAQKWLERERANWSGRLKTPVRTADAVTVVDSFCGVQVHRAALAALAVEGHAEGATCELKAPLPVLVARARSLLADFDAVLDDHAARVAPQLHIRFPELVPPAVLVTEARRFHVDAHGLHRFLAMLSES